MSGSLVNEYGIGDTNFDNIMETLDTQRRGILKLSLTNMDNTSTPQIEGGSIVEVGTDLYGINSNMSPSFTDPYTSSTVADGVVYIVLQQNMGTASGETTDNTGYSIGDTVITLDSAGTGSIIVGDRITFTGDTIVYEVTSGNSDVSDGGSITIASPGLITAIASSTTAITIVAAGSITSSVTATVPVWDATYQGYYKSGTLDRYVGGGILSSSGTLFNGKYVYNRQDIYKGKTIILIQKSTIGTVAVTENPLIYDTVELDTKLEYNSTTGIVTIKKDGYYYINSHTTFFTSSVYNNISCNSNIMLNSSAITENRFYDSGQYTDRSVSLPTSILVYLEEDDEITVRAAPTNINTYRAAGVIYNYLTINEI